MKHTYAWRFARFDGEQGEDAEYFEGDKIGFIDGIPAFSLTNAQLLQVALDEGVAEFEPVTDADVGTFDAEKIHYGFLREMMIDCWCIEDGSYDELAGGAL
jgi:hypothetical protein